MGCIVPYEKENEKEKKKKEKKKKEKKKKEKKNSPLTKKEKYAIIIIGKNA